MKIRFYSELIQIKDFFKRYEYLKLVGNVGETTFGFDRILNQKFYNSIFWKQVRRKVLIRDKGLDLGVIGHEIINHPIIHHMNPILIKDFTEFNPEILDPEFLITTSRYTHSAIHFGDKNLLPELPVTRFAGDTKLW